MLLTLVGSSAFAQKKLGFSGRPTNLHEQNLANFIDFDLIKNDLGTREVNVQIGEYEFKGELKCPGLEVSQEEMDKIADKVFKDMNLTSGIMERIENDLAANNLGPNADWMSLTEDLCAIAGVGFPPASMLGDVVAVANGSESAQRGIYNVAATFTIAAVTATAAAAAGASAPVVLPLTIAAAKVANVVTGGATLYEKLPSAYKNIGKVKDFLSELADGNPTARRCMEGALIHTRYYKAVNALIAQEAMKKDVGTWQLNIDKAQDKDKPFFGMGITQTAHLTMHLQMNERIGQNAKHNWQGVYKGSVTLRLTHNLQNFDKNFKNVVFSTLPKAYYFTYPEDATGGNSSLVKDIESSTFSIELKSSDKTISNGMKQTFSLNGFQVKSFFNCNKLIVGKANYGEWKNGGLRLSGSSGNKTVVVEGKGIMNLDFLGSLADNKCTAVLQVFNQDDFFHVTGGGFLLHHGGMSPTNVSGRRVAEDGTIFSDLKRLKFIEVSSRKIEL